MPNYSAEAIILSMRDFAEADKIVTLFSKEKGIIESIAKGARRPTSRKTPSIEILNIGKFSLATGRNLHILLEANISNQISSGFENEKLNYVFYISEILKNSLSHSDNSKEIWSNIISLIPYTKDYFFHALIKLQLAILDELGMPPSFDFCAVTEKSLIENRSQRDGLIGYVVLEKGRIEISDRILKIQKFIQQKELSKTLKLQITEGDFNIIFAIQNDWIETALEREVKSFKLASSG
jgi:DNA repair protein RecO (recombination protein O)